MSLIRINFHIINDLSWLFPSPISPFRSWIKCDPLSLNAFPPSIFPIRVESQLLRTHYKATMQPLTICPPNMHTHTHTHFSSSLPLGYFLPSQHLLWTRSCFTFRKANNRTAYKDKLSTRIGFSNDYRDSWGPSYLKKYKGSSLGF